MNQKIKQYKRHLETMLLLVDTQQIEEELHADDDPQYVKERESVMIEDFAAELAALNQLAFQHIAKHKGMNALFIDNEKAVAIML